ncbi:MAG TPA: PAS domain-containing protein, partial [Flavisolibacter sp.]|nr:PAS domain-containing protein [Flavisolibacter sp.]
MNQQTSSNTASEFSKEEAFDLILNNIEDVYTLVNKDLKIIALNKAAVEGIRRHYNKEVAPGFYLLDMLEPNRHAPLKALFAEVLRGASHKTETAFRLEDGTKVYYENAFSPAYDATGAIAGIILRSTNITEKKKAELILQESEERLRFALEATNQGAWDWNMQTDEVIYSSSYKKMYGFTDDELKNHLLEWESRIHPDDRQKMQAAIKIHTQSEEAYYESTYRLKVKNGAYKWIMARGKMIGKNSEGKPSRMIGTHTDITEIKEAQEELKTAAERFAYAAKATGQALWEWNARTGEAYISTSFTEMFGWAADDNHYFEQWHHYIHPEDQAQTVKGYYDTINNPQAETWNAEYRFQKADGTYAVVCDKAYILRDEVGKATKVIGATQDITARKITEEELYKSNERFDIMMMATNELLWDWDIKANRIHRSQTGVRKVYGLENDLSLQKIEQWLERVHPDDRPRLDHIFSSLEKASHHQTFEAEYRFQKGNGEYAFFYNRGILLKDKDQKPLRLIGASQDISERKRLEKELLKTELEYKKAINQATVDSQEQERGEIGKELHDNVNQVLTTTKLYLELALANEDLVHELIKKSSKNISTVINEIRQLSRSLMDPSLGDLGIIDSINDLIGNINLTRKVHITLDIDEEIEDLLNKAQKLTMFRIIQESLN